MKIKILIIAALFLIVAILFSISIKSELKIIYPQNSTHITDRTPTLMWQGSADELWLSKNSEFDNAEKIKLRGRSYTAEELDTETYYWKLIGVTNISGEFTIDGTAILQVERTESQLRIKNIGNVDLELSMENTINSLAKITGAMILEQGKTILLPNKNNTVVVAKEK